MSLVWHIAKKDIRRLALPVAAWLAMLVGTTTWLSIATPTPVGHIGSELVTWAGLMSIWLRLIVVLQAVVLYLLAGSLVLDDALEGTTVFWKTRPVSARRLLGGKLLAAVLLFGAAPTVALAPVWFMSGFDARDVWAAALRVGLEHGSVVVIAMGIASVMRNLPQFLLGTVVMLAVVYGAMILSQGLFTLTACAPLMAGVMGLHYFTRRLTWSFALWGAGVIGCILLSFGAPISGARGAVSFPDRKGGAEQPADRAAEIMIPNSFENYDRNGRSLPFVRISAPWTREHFYAPALGVDRDGRVVLRPSASWGQEVARRALRVGEDGPLRWQLFSAGARIDEGHGELAEAGKVWVWVANAKLVGECALEQGKEIAAEGARTRILGFMRTGDRLDEIFLEERSAIETADRSLRRGLADPGRRFTHVDHYFLVDQEARELVQAASMSEVARVQANQLNVSFLRLFVSGTRDWKSAKLVKVRIEPERIFERPFDLKGVTIPRRPR